MLTTHEPSSKPIMILQVPYHIILPAGDSACGLIPYTKVIPYLWPYLFRWKKHWRNRNPVEVPSSTAVFSVSFLVLFIQFLFSVPLHRNSQKRFLSWVPITSLEKLLFIFFMCIPSHSSAWNFISFIVSFSKPNSSPALLHKDPSFLLPSLFWSANFSTFFSSSVQDHPNNFSPSTDPWGAQVISPFRTWHFIPILSPVFKLARDFSFFIHGSYAFLRVSLEWP